MAYPSHIEDTLNALRERFALLADLGSAESLLMWDRQTYMPPAAADSRGHQSAALEGVVHEKLTDPRVGEWLARLEQAELSGDDEALVSLCRRAFDQSCKLPPHFVEKYAEARSHAQQAWLDARARNDYDVFEPALRRLVDMLRERAELLGYEQHPYDALHDEYEVGSTAARVRDLFEQVKEPLVALLGRIERAGRSGRDELLTRDYDPARQNEFALEAVALMGFDLEGGRLDTTVHPFCQGVGRGDVRITTRYLRNFLSAGIFAALHEAGHGVYEQGLPAQWSRGPLGEAVSLGVHESQSRLWENLIGRSLPYWRGAFPRLRQLFPEALSKVGVDKFYRAVNAVKPSLIRVEADEVTYNLHIIARFELELGLLDGSLDTRELREAWAEKYRELLGIEVPDDIHGCLQDVHWSHGLVGYFPTYSLGNLMSVQIFEAMSRSVGGADELIERGEFGPILEWLRENIYRFGSRYRPDELLRRATGSGLDAAPYLRYLERKFTPLYDGVGA